MISCAPAVVGRVRPRSTLPTVIGVSPVRAATSTSLRPSSRRRIRSSDGLFMAGILERDIILFSGWDTSEVVLPNAWRTAEGRPVEAITDTPLIGFEERRLFHVNSGQSLHRESVKDAFPEAAERGHVPVSLIEKELRGTVLLSVRGSGDYVVGRVAIRQVVEAKLPEPKPKRRAKVGDPKRSSRKRKANRVLNELPIRQLRGVVDYISKAALDRSLEEHPARSKKNKTAGIAKARLKRWP